ncbi:MAG: hypothetical protein H7Z75_23235 [Ferruginibacter sp.]|nr:hypothetical protein [Cytophagales bacterium]
MLPSKMFLASLSGDKVIIPVAQVLLGMGGGYGNGIQQDKKSLPPEPSQAVSSGKPEAPVENGGGGMVLIAKGVCEVTPKTTRFIPAHNLRQLAIVLTAGFPLGRLFAPRHSRNAKL